MLRHFPEKKPKHGILKGIWSLKKEVLSHSNFNSCSSQKSRRISHFLVFYGFILLLAVTVFAIVAAITHNYPLKFTNPFKILGNVAGIMLIVGLGIMFYDRLFNKKVFGNSNYADWLFLISMFLLTISGGLLEIARFQNWASAYHLYFFHLVCVWFIVIYLPYTKFGHVLYRIVAMSFANSIDRK